MIQPGEIARLAHRLGLGDKTIEKDYVLTWTLLAIAASPLRDRLAFKGGTELRWPIGWRSEQSFLQERFYA